MIRGPDYWEERVALLNEENAAFKRRLAESYRQRVEIERQKVVLKRELAEARKLQLSYAMQAEESQRQVVALEEELAEAKFEIKNIHC